MKDGEKRKELESPNSGQSLSNFFDVGFILQSIWIRCRSVFPYITDRKFMESEFRFVLYCGGVLWLVYILSKIV